MIHAAATTRKLDGDNPWPGLESYEEDAQDFFFGRDHEAKTLLKKVLDAPVTVFYGRSGLGKTSLLRAGLFPLLREENFLPIYVRFQVKTGTASLTRQLRDAVRDSIHADVPDAVLPSEEESLWEYLHRVDFELWSARNYQLTPVIVLDQFEELFTLGERVRDRVDAFRNELGDLVENRIPADLAARITNDEAVAGRFNLRSRNYKLLVSLREDYLPHLEEWCRLIPALGRSRMRLLPLRAHQALDAVHKPAAHLMTAELAGHVVDIIAGADLHPGRETESSNNDSGADRRSVTDVEPALLSLICRELNEERKRRGQAEFDDRLIEDHGRETLSNYYSSCVRDLRPGVAEFIESELITETGFRDFYALDEAVPSRLTDDELAKLISLRLLRIVDHYGAQRIELTHDVLTHAVREHRDRRRAEEVKEKEKAALAEAAERERQALERAAAQREEELDRERLAERERRLESERAAAGRLKKLTVALAIVSILAIALAAVAAMNWRSARLLGQDALAKRLSADSQLMLAELSPLGSHDVKLMHMLLAAHAIRSTQQAGNYELLTTLNEERDVLEIIDLPAVTKGVAFSADGTRIASGSDDNIVRLWDTDGRLIGQPMRHDNKVSSVAFSPDGTRIASGSEDNTVRLWNIDGNLIGQPMRHDNKVTSVAFSPDGTRIASGSEDNTVRLWNTDGELIGQPMRHDNKVTGVAFSPDGRLIASGSNDNTVRLWDTAGRLIGQPMRHDNKVIAVAFSPDGTRIATGSEDFTLRVWDARTQRPIGEPLGAGAITSVAFSPDGARIATGGIDRTIRLWDTETGSPVGILFGHEAAVMALAYGPDNRHLVSTGSDGTVRLWDSSWQPMIGHEAGVLAGFYDDGRRIGSGSWDNTVRWWEPATGRPIGKPLHVDDADVKGLFPVDENRFLSFGSINDAQMWDAGTGKPIGEPLRLPTDPYMVTDEAVTRIAAHLEPAVVQIYKTETMGPVGKRILPEEEVWNSTFSADGRILATGGVSGVVELWDTDTGARIGQPMKDGGGNVWSIRFSRDGQLLAVGHEDYTVRLWDTETFLRVGEPIALEDSVVIATAFSPDGRTLASGGDDGSIQLWDVADQSPLGAPLGFHDGSVLSLEFSPDGMKLLSASDDQTLRVWPVIQPNPALLCDKLTHNMTRDQWDQMVSSKIDAKTVCPNLPESDYAG